MVFLLICCFVSLSHLPDVTGFGTFLPSYASRSSLNSFNRHWMTKDPTDMEWDVDLYRNKHSFVWKYGADLIELAAPQPGETVLDVGCGSGELTNEMAKLGARAIGMDSDPEMVRKAQQLYPQADFFVGDIRSLILVDKVDTVFSNAALHWVPREGTTKAVESIAKALRPGGRFVAEFGGKGNVRLLVQTCHDALLAIKGGTEFVCPWYFPSIAEYTSLLEDAGLEVLSAELFDRPTVLEDGNKGLQNWYRMFADVFLAEVIDNEDEFILLMNEIEKRLKNQLYDGIKWTADYRRIRVVATKL